MAHPVKSRLSQETLAIVGVGVALAALILTVSVGVRGEIQAVRAEARADREAMRAAHETFQSQILRLTEQQSVLGGRVEIIRNQLATRE